MKKFVRGVTCDSAQAIVASKPGLLPPLCAHAQNFITRGSEAHTCAAHQAQQKRLSFIAFSVSLLCQYKCIYRKATNIAQVFCDFLYNYTSLIFVHLHTEIH
jgi:hypothetical protein